MNKLTQGLDTFKVFDMKRQATEWDNSLYKNWVRGAKGLEYLQEGLRDFVGDKVQSRRDEVLQNIVSTLPAGSSTTCSECTSENLLPEHAPQGEKSCSRLKRCIQIKSASNCFGNKPSVRRKCPNGICSKLYDAIVLDHKFRDPLWKNTDPSTWSTDPKGWSYAKCFETTLGQGTSAKDTDAAGLLSILLNNISMQNWLACNDMGDKNTCSFYRAKDIRNEILHSPKLELEDARLDNCLETFIAVLKDSKCLVSYNSAYDAVNKLTKLQNNQICISENDKKRLTLLHETMLEIDKRKDGALQEIAERGSSAAKQAKKEACEEIVETKRVALTEIKVAKTAAINEVAGLSGPDTSTPAGPTELKEDLIALYRKTYNTIPLSPLMQEEDTPLLDIFVGQELKTVELQRALGGGKEITTPVNSLVDVFYKKNKQCHDIYLTADAGLGKTVFCKRLALTWCHAKKPFQNQSNHFSDEEIKAVGEFDFLFLVFLRDSAGKCDIDGLIMSQIIQHLAHTFSKKTLENILSKEKCLIILDGLDEWSHPQQSCTYGPSDVPHRKAREWTILTTTRPWKLSSISLKTSQIDRKIELVGVNTGQADALKLKVIAQLSDSKDEGELKDLEKKFKIALGDKDISALQNIPLIVTFLLCVWFEQIDLGDSQCEFYSSIVELFLLTGVKKFGEIQVEDSEETRDIPYCFKKYRYCKLYYGPLTSLSKLAFHTLFAGSQENSLVFDSSVAEMYVDEKDLNFFFFSGIISKNKVRKLTANLSTVQFVHKTVQEFLAALYMHSNKAQEAMQEKVLAKCKEIKDILEMSKVFIFLSGIDAGVFSTISTELFNIIANDDISQTYRRSPSSYYYEKYVQPLKDVQEMCIACIKEYRHQNDLKLPIQDIFINGQCQNESHTSCLKKITKTNKAYIKSVSIEMAGTSFDVQGAFKMFSLSDLGNIEKYYYRGVTEEREIKPLIPDKLKCLSLISSKWKNNHFEYYVSSVSQSLLTKLCSLNKLEAVYIDGFKMTHALLSMLLNYISDRKCMREVMLLNLECEDHTTCCSLDLSGHSNLRTIALAKVPLSTLKINVSSLEDCEIGHLSKQGLVSNFMEDLKAAKKLITFICSYLESPEDIKTMIDTIRLLVHIKDIWLWDINLGEKSLTLSPEMKHLEYLRLRGVQMLSSSFSDLIDVVQKLPQPVTVYMRDCTFIPAPEFEEVKQKKLKSKQFVMTYDDVYKNGQVTVFKSIKE